MRYPLICSALITVILVFFQRPLNAQGIKDLPGKWYTNNIIRMAGSDTVSKATLELLLGRNSFNQFSANHRYIAFQNNSYSYGTWELNGNKLHLLNDQNGGVFSYEVNRVSKDELLLSISGKLISFVKAKDSLIADKKPEPDTTPRVKANKSQVAKKWYFSKIIEVPENRSATANNIFKNSWYDLRNDGTCTRKFSKPVEGTWELTDGGKRLLIIDNTGIGQVWNIAGISGNELILQLPNGKVQRIYSTEPTP